MKNKTYLIYANAKLMHTTALSKRMAIALAETFSKINDLKQADYPIKVFEVSAGSKFKEIHRIKYLKVVK